LEADIDFVLVGGFASVVHGSTLVTQDLDICMLVSEETIQKLRSALHDLNPRHRMNPAASPSFLDEPRDLSAVRNIYLRTDWGVLDIMSDQAPAGDFSQLKSRAVEVDLYGHKCKVISLDDLIKIKESMNRPKDMQTLEELKRIRDLKKT
jgi:hypothetical protein